MASSRQSPAHDEVIEELRINVGEMTSATLSQEEVWVGGVLRRRVIKREEGPQSLHFTPGEEDACPRPRAYPSTGVSAADEWR